MHGNNFPFLKTSIAKATHVKHRLGRKRVDADALFGDRSRRCSSPSLERVRCEARKVPRILSDREAGAFGTGTVRSPPEHQARGSGLQKIGRMWVPGADRVEG